MILLSSPGLSEETECPYIKGEECRFSFFFARNVLPQELDQLLSTGWRKFGIYFFRPDCRNCRKCIPLRMKTGDIQLSKGQKRILKHGNDVRIKFNDLLCRDEIFEIYKKHSWEKFSREADYQDFINSFYDKSCPSMQAEYYINSRLIAVGYLDISSHALSSIYFFYDTDYNKLSPGRLSIIREAQQASAMGLPYYYLGYYIQENRSMSYKNDFQINEKMDWETGIWK